MTEELARAQPFFWPDKIYAQLFSDKPPANRKLYYSGTIWKPDPWAIVCDLAARLLEGGRGRLAKLGDVHSETCSRCRRAIHFPSPGEDDLKDKAFLVEIGCGCERTKFSVCNRCHVVDYAVSFLCEPPTCPKCHKAWGLGDLVPIRYEEN